MHSFILKFYFIYFILHYTQAILVVVLRLYPVMHYKQRLFSQI